ncbi:MAG: DUF2853 family protein [Rhizobiales bacterium]|nr:DUF2853 family protein [Hyphomicrobiales bacterium]MBO6697670.1 DUF2853 family protein [Hyphomicrobiales bacterium]MBO6736075.1 DUF2853 family protein [Hyphomicrobiales bacterium]MBO6912545.1 DUF2853 family protein [Hyphomicrobiales bacterium]MBO6956947.1 DUF2853 family protein [Hyphomicrobiales bacterium]
MADYLADVKKFASDVDEAAVNGIVRHLGVALRSRDASMVACTDPKELARIRDGFCRKKLRLDESDDAIDGAIQTVCEAMKADTTKARVTFYYLLAEQYGKLDLFHKKS